MFRYDVFFNFSFIREKAQLIVQVLYHCTFAGGSGDLERLQYDFRHV